VGDDGAARVGGGRAVSRRRAPRIALAAGALTAWDVFLDPRMAREGYWSWPGGGRYEGIPASNFLGWFVTGLGVFASGPCSTPTTTRRRRRRRARAVRVDVARRGFANAVLWRRPVTAAAGGAAMGAFASRAAGAAPAPRRH
jgi:putative membrane protein